MGLQQQNDVTKKDIELKIKCVSQRAIMKLTAKMGLFQNQPKCHKFCSFEELYAGSPTETNNKKISTR